jgi:predicted nucleic acid-binding protein
LTALVLDASAAVAFASPDERTEAIEAMIDRIMRYGAFVPSLWLYETANALHYKRLRNPSSASEVLQAIAILHSLPVDIVELDASAFQRSVLPLCLRHQLTVYGASYLHLAIKLALPLATFDRKLLAAALVEKVETIDF